MPDRILVVDDQPEMCEYLRDLLKERGHHVECLLEPEPVLQRIGDSEHGCDLVVLDLDFGRTHPDGLQVLSQLKERDADLPVVMLSGKGTIDKAVQAMRLGAANFVEKHPETMERDLLETIERELRIVRERRERRELETRTRALEKERDYFREQQQRRYDIVGEDPKWLAALALARKVASLPRPVLLRGERGTGKELIAHTIHHSGSRRDGPFVVVNCAAIAEGLLECELFGQEENAFDGAPFKLGRFEIADRGTLFLDEIGNMSLDFQMKMLRVIEYQSFERVQGTERIDVDVRILAATNADVQHAIEAGRFRPDLYDRLTFQVIELPPLRERSGDIPLLCEHFVNRFAAEVPGIEPKPVSPEAVARLQEYDWPGNVRELKNVIENALLHSRGRSIERDDLPMPHTPAGPRAGEGGEAGAFPEKVGAFERGLLLDALSATGWNQKKTAELLGLNYDQLRHLYRKYDLAQQKPE